MMYPRGENVKNPHDPETVAHVARIGAECGADIVKTIYTDDMSSFADIVKSTPRSNRGGRRTQDEYGYGTTCHDRRGNEGWCKGCDVWQEHLCTFKSTKDHKGVSINHLWRVICRTSGEKA